MPRQFIRRDYLNLMCARLAIWCPILLSVYSPLRLPFFIA